MVHTYAVHFPPMMVDNVSENIYLKATHAIPYCIPTTHSVHIISDAFNDLPKAKFNTTEERLTITQNTRHLHPHSVVIF